MIPCTAAGDRSNGWTSNWMVVDGAMEIGEEMIRFTMTDVGSAYLIVSPCSKHGKVVQELICLFFVPEGSFRFAHDGAVVARQRRRGPRFFHLHNTSTSPLHHHRIPPLNAWCAPLIGLVKGHAPDISSSTCMIPLYIGLPHLAFFFLCSSFRLLLHTTHNALQIYLDMRPPAGHRRH